MTERPLGTDTTDITEPVHAADPVAGAGSVSSAAAPVQRPTLAADLLRAVLVALLVGGCIAAPDSAPLLAPFAPGLAAIRVIRHRAGARRFLLVATVLSLLLAGLASQSPATGAAGLAVAAMLVPGLVAIHVRAARRDPITEAEQPAWPEPRLDTGFSLALLGWLVALVATVAIVLPVLDSPRATGSDIIRDTYATYLDECRDGGQLASADSFCDEIRTQRSDALDLLDDHGAEALGALVALLAFGFAGTAHPIVLARSRRTGASVRQAWHLRLLEVHWSAAYLLAAGLVAWMLLPGSDAAGWELARAAAVAAGSLGTLLVFAQGVAFAVWLFTRGRTPAWYRAIVIISALLALPIAIVLVFGLGVLDMALHPRRRALRSGSISGRGSGS